MSLFRKFKANKEKQNIVPKANRDFAAKVIGVDDAFSRAKKNIDKIIMPSEYKPVFCEMMDDYSAYFSKQKGIKIDFDDIFKRTLYNGKLKIIIDEEHLKDTGTLGSYKQDKHTIFVKQLDKNNIEYFKHILTHEFLHYIMIEAYLKFMKEKDIKAWVNEGFTEKIAMQINNYKMCSGYENFIKIAEHINAYLPKVNGIGFDEHSFLTNQCYFFLKAHKLELLTDVGVYQVSGDFYKERLTNHNVHLPLGKTLGHEVARAKLTSYGFPERKVLNENQICDLVMIYSLQNFAQRRAKEIKREHILDSRSRKKYIKERYSFDKTIDVSNTICVMLSRKYGITSNEDNFEGDSILQKYCQELFDCQMALSKPDKLTAEQICWLHNKMKEDAMLFNERVSYLDYALCVASDKVIQARAIPKCKVDFAIEVQKALIIAQKNDKINKEQTNNHSADGEFLETM